jgi:hypothetical protein
MAVLSSGLLSGPYELLTSIRMSVKRPSSIGPQFVELALAHRAGQAPGTPVLRINPAIPSSRTFCRRTAPPSESTSHEPETCPDATTRSMTALGAPPPISTLPFGLPVAQ